MKKVALICIVLIMALLLPEAGLAEQKIIFAWEEYPPYEYYENGKIVGFEVDIIREICKKLGAEPVFEDVPLKRALMLIKEGKVDAVFSIMKTPERLGYLYYPVEPVYFETNVILVKKGSKLKIKTLDDMKGKKVGVVKEYSYGTNFDSLKGSMVRDESDSIEQMLKKMDAGRTDYAVGNEQVCRFLAKKLGIAIEVIHVVSKDPAYVVFSKATGERGKKQAMKFGRLLRQLRNDGTIDKIMARY